MRVTLLYDLHCGLTAYIWLDGRCEYKSSSRVLHSLRISLSAFTGWTICQVVVCSGQCDQIWRNFASLAKVYKSLANFWQLISYLEKCWAYILWQIRDIIGLIFIFANGQILKNNQTIWSHCLWHTSVIWTQKLIKTFFGLHNN